MSVQSSSSGESLTGSVVGDNFEEEVLEVEGESEFVLLQRKERRQDTAAVQPVDENLLGGQGFTEFFKSCLSSLKKEEVIKRSPRGQNVSVILDAIEALEPEKIADIALSMITLVNQCFTGDNHKLPSAIQALMWSSFHQLRLSKEMKKTWNRFVATHIPASSQKEPHLALQLLLDRILKQLVSNKAKSVKKTAQAPPLRPMTAMESNAIRYMSGYVAVSLLKRYKKPTQNPQLKLKRELFVTVLTRMKAYSQPGEPSSVLEYTTLWSEMIDRGGLYHINDQVFRLMESIEFIVRKYLNIHTFSPTTDVRQCILEEVLKSETILALWEDIADTIPHKFERYSIELLKNVTGLWITVRGYSFAKEWTMKFERKYKKGTRKSLKTVAVNK